MPKHIGKWLVINEANKMDKTLFRTIYKNWETWLRLHQDIKVLKLTRVMTIIQEWTQQITQQEMLLHRIKWTLVKWTLYLNNPMIYLNSNNSSNNFKLKLLDNQIPA